MLGPAIVISVGGGLLNTPVITTVTSGTTESDTGAAAGLMNTTKQVGGAIGLAVLVGISGSHLRTPADLAAGYDRVFLTIAAILVVVAAVALVLPAGRRATASRMRP